MGKPTHFSALNNLFHLLLSIQLSTHGWAMWGPREALTLGQLKKLCWEGRTTCRQGNGWLLMFSIDKPSGQAFLTKINKHISPQDSHGRRHHNGDSKISSWTVRKPPRKILWDKQSCASSQRKCYPACTWIMWCPRKTVIFLSGNVNVNQRSPCLGQNMGYEIFPLNG